MKYDPRWRMLFSKTKLETLLNMLRSYGSYADICLHDQTNSVMRDISL